MAKRTSPWPQTRSRGLSERNPPVAVDDVVEASALAHAREFFEGGFVVELRLRRPRHRSRLTSKFRDDGFKEIRGRRPGGGESRVPLVQQAAQFIYLRHDPALFGEGRDHNK